MAFCDRAELVKAALVVGVLTKVPANAILSA